MKDHIEKQCQKAIALTIKETKTRAKKDIKEAIHEGNVMDGVRKRRLKGGWENE